MASALECSTPAISPTTALLSIFEAFQAVKDNRILLIFFHYVGDTRNFTEGTCEMAAFFKTALGKIQKKEAKISAVQLLLGEERVKCAVMHRFLKDHAAILPLQNVVDAGNQPVVLVYLEAGAKPTREMFIAAMQQNFETDLISKFIKQGIKIDKSLAVMAIEHGCLFVVKSYFTKKQKPTQKHFDLAMQHNQQEIMKYMSEIGIQGGELSLNSSPEACAVMLTGWKDGMAMAKANI